MRHKAMSMQGTAISLAFIVGMMFIFLPRVYAQPKIVPVEGVSYNVNGSIADNLKSLAGKKIEVTLDSGKTFTGVVKEVGNHLMCLEKLEGKEYFDALIVIEDISAIDTRFRTDQR